MKNAAQDKAAGSNHAGTSNRSDYSTTEKLLPRAVGTWQGAPRSCSPFRVALTFYTTALATQAPSRFSR